MGSTLTLSAAVSPSSASDTSISWTSSATAVATVDSGGVVTGIATGSATITAASKDGNRSASAVITVISASSATTGVILDRESATIVVDGTVLIVASVLPRSTTDKSLTWSSSNEAIAAVSGDGVVKGKGAGSATISATSTANSKSASCVVTVLASAPIAVESITITAAAATGTSIFVGGSTQLTAAILPNNASIKTPTWSSSDPSIATVDSSGLVIGKATGTVTITAAADSMSKTTNIVVNTISVIAVTITPSIVQTLAIGGKLQLSATVSPSNAPNQNVTWSSNSSIATVSSTGLVTGVAAGSTWIYATSSDGPAGSLFIYVADGAVTGVSLTTSSLTMAAGESFTMTAGVQPTYAPNQVVTWSTSDSSVATVNTSTGVVTAITSGGTAKITATTSEGSYAATCTVTVDSFPFKRIQATAGSNWSGIAVSKTADLLALCGTDKGIITSTDRGATWTQHSTTSGTSWGNISMSGDGSLLAAYVSNGNVYTSTDKGVSWTKQSGAGSRAWADIAVSGDGSTIVGCVGSGYLWISSDQGVSWSSQQAGGAAYSWKSVAISKDGSVILAAPYGDYLYKGVYASSAWTWTKQTSPDVKYWTSVAMSDDGLVMHAINDSYDYKSIDGGSNWTQVDTGNHSLQVVAASAAADKVIAFQSYNYGSYYPVCSFNSGSSWTVLNRSISANDSTFSGDGTLAAFTDGTYAYVYDIPATATSLASTVGLGDIGLAIVGPSAYAKTGSETFTARYESSSSVTIKGWYIDNVLKASSGTSYTIGASTYTVAGSHTITLQAYAQGRYFSASFRFAVQ